MLQTLTVKLKILTDQASGQLLLDTMAAYSRACSFVAERIVEEHLPFSTYKVRKEVYHDIRFLVTSFDGKGTFFASGTAVKRKQAHYREPHRGYGDQCRPGIHVPDMPCLRPC